MKIKVTTVGAAWTLDGNHTGPGPWLGLIHECNRLTNGAMFREARFSRDGDDNYMEVYPDATVTMIGEDAQDQLVTITSRNDRGYQIIDQAAENMGLRFTKEEN